jgi:hypothetical protein
VRVGFSMDAQPSDDSSEDCMLVLSSRASLEEACDDVEVITRFVDSIICPRYDSCVLRYGRLPELSS